MNLSTRQQLFQVLRSVWETPPLRAGIAGALLVLFLLLFADNISNVLEGIIATRQVDPPGS